MMGALTGFQFEGKPVRTLMRDDMPWWVLADVCKPLEIVNTARAASRLDDDEKGVHTVNTPGGEQEMTIINESGLYALILTSRKPAARRFKKWITSEVLPALRRDGVYDMRGADADLPSRRDDTIFGVKVATLNAAARAVAVIERIYGPEAARALWEKDGTLPQVRKHGLVFHANSEDEDPEECLKHLLAADMGDGTRIGAALSLALHDRPAANRLKDYGIIVDPVEAHGHVAIMNRHRYLAAIFSDTHWCLEWQSALMQLPGAHPARKLGITGKREQGVLLPKSTVEAIMAGGDPPE